MAVPLLLLFGTLFAAADPLFARYTSDLAHSLDEVLDFIDREFGQAANP